MEMTRIQELDRMIDLNLQLIKEGFEGGLGREFAIARLDKVEEFTRMKKELEGGQP